jgi:hypothetical protein
MLVGHKTFYVKGGKLAYLGTPDVMIVKSDIDDIFIHYNRFIAEVLKEDEKLFSYIIFYDDGTYSNGFLNSKDLESIVILTETEIMIRDIIQ